MVVGGKSFGKFLNRLPYTGVPSANCSGASMTVADWPRGREAKGKAKEQDSRIPLAPTLAERRYKRSFRKL